MATAAATVTVSSNTRINHDVADIPSKYDHLLFEKQQLEALLTTKFPEIEDVVFDRDLELLMLNGVWRKRRIIYTKEVLIFAKPGSENRTDVFDAIPFFEIDVVNALNVDETIKPEETVPADSLNSEQQDNVAVQSGSGEEVVEGEKLKRTNTVKRRDTADYLPADRILEATTATSMINTVEIRTIIDGYNSGRVYYIQADGGSECRKIAGDIQEFSHICIQRFELRTTWERIRDKVKTIYDSNQVQGFVGCLIIMNFVCNIVESQLNGKLTDANGNPNQSAAILEALDKAFTGLFAFELVVNMVSNLWSRFVNDGWCRFDFLIVSMSLIALGSVPVPSSMIRLLRAFRVLRLFGKIPAVKQIIMALSWSLFPVMNAFILLFAAVGIYAIVGVNFFSDVDPRDFGRFDRAFASLFRIVSGDAWPDHLDELGEEGELLGVPVAYICSFRLIVEFVLLQVSVAVLLDNFVQASALMEQEEEERKYTERKNAAVVRNPLDPFLQKLSKEYMDDDDLSSRLRSYFEEMDEDESGSVSYREMCTQLRRLPFQPPIHVTMSDYEVITQDGTLCHEGEMSSEEFEKAMRVQLSHYLQRQSSNLLDIGDISEGTGSQLETLKMVVMAQERTAQATEHAEKTLDGLEEAANAVAQSFIGLRSSIRPLAAAAQAAAAAGIVVSDGALASRGPWAHAHGGEVRQDVATGDDDSLVMAAGASQGGLVTVSRSGGNAAKQQSLPGGWRGLMLEGDSPTTTAVKDSASDGGDADGERKGGVLVDSSSRSSGDSRSGGSTTGSSHGCVMDKGVEGSGVGPVVADGGDQSRGPVGPNGTSPQPHAPAPAPAATPGGSSRDGAPRKRLVFASAGGASANPRWSAPWEDAASSMFSSRGPRAVVGGSVAGGGGGHGMNGFLAAGGVPGGELRGRPARLVEGAVPLHRRIAPSARDQPPLWRLSPPHASNGGSSASSFNPPPLPPPAVGRESSGTGRLGSEVAVVPTALADPVIVSDMARELGLGLMATMWGPGLRLSRLLARGSSDEWAPRRSEPSQGTSRQGSYPSFQLPPAGDTTASRFGGSGDLDSWDSSMEPSDNEEERPSSAAAAAAAAAARHSWAATSEDAGPPTPPPEMDSPAGPSTARGSAHRDSHASLAAAVGSRGGLGGDARRWREWVDLT